MPSRIRHRAAPQVIVATIALMIAVVCAPPSFAGVYTKEISPRTNIKTIAIISAIGESFMFEHVAASPLEWLGPPGTSFLEIGDWGLDARVAREAKQALSKKFAVEPVGFEEADFDTWTWPTLLQHIDELHGHDIDAYVVILRDWRDDAIGGTAHQIAGLGLYRRDTGDRQRIGVFACYRIAVIDAHHDSVLASRRIFTADGKLPWLPIAPALWPETQNDLTAAQTAILQSDTRALIDDTLTPALDEMFSLR
jgi:hypothetical protein